MCWEQKDTSPCLTTADPGLGSNTRGDFPDLTGRAPAARTPRVYPSKSWVMKRPATDKSGAVFIFAHSQVHAWRRSA